MTDLQIPSLRKLSCERCGTVFACRPDGGCWCALVPDTLPLNATGFRDCLCPNCLRDVAKAQRTA